MYGDLMESTGSVDSDLHWCPECWHWSVEIADSNEDTGEAERYRCAECSETWTADQYSPREHDALGRLREQEHRDERRYRRSM